MMTRPTLVASLLLLLLAGPATPGVLADGHRGGRVTGTVWDATDRGVGGALIRLRNVVTGAIEALATADDAGQFRFEAVAPGSYIIEVINGKGAIAAVGQSFTVGHDESVATLVRLAPKVPWIAGFFGNAAAAAVAAAASIGVTAITPDGQNISPGR